MRNILGISAYYHDSAAAIVVDGNIMAAAQEERFTRKKHDAGFPGNAILFCLEYTGLSISDLDVVVFYDKPFVKFERLLETYIANVPKGFHSFLSAMPVWLKEKLYLKSTIRKELSLIGNCKIKEIPPLLFTQHHQSHAASAFFPSPFDEAVILCMDGVGEWATTSVWVGKKNTITPLWEIDFPHSLGLLYSAFTYFTGFEVNSGEYKLMGLAPYGEPIYTDLILKHLIDVKQDGTFHMNMEYFNYSTGLTMTNQKFHNLFGAPPREPEAPIEQREMDIAASIQKVTEEIILRLARTIKQETNMNNLCLAGGVALNCVANGRLIRERIFNDLWIQPAAGDAGGAIGSALSVWHEYYNQPRTVIKPDKMNGAFLGPEYSNEDIRLILDNKGAKYEELNDNILLSQLAKILADEMVIGWFQGRMEFGPRALGARSIIGDPRSKKLQSLINMKIKYRESFRPFAPSILAENVSDYFELEKDSPYMLIVADVTNDIRIPVTEGEEQLFGVEKLNVLRSEIPAVTHVDYSARIQTVHENTNPRYYNLIKQFKKHTGYPILINTSFNVRDEPVVCTPEDAYKCFMQTDMDYLVMENCLLRKADQPEFIDDNNWQQKF